MTFMRITFACIAFALALMSFSTEGLAHSPHDSIDALALSPDFGHDDHTLFIAIADQVLRSQDGGYQWKKLAQGLDNQHLVAAICMSPFYAADRTVFLATVGDGLYRSVDGGDSWVADSQGLPSPYIQSIYISPDGLLLVVDTHGRLGHKMLRENRWHALETGGVQVTAIGFSGREDGRTIMYLGGRNGRLMVSADQGNSFQERYVFKDSGAITAVAAAAGESRGAVVYVGTEKGGIYRSMDGGTSFASAGDGITERHIIDIAVSDENSARLYATTWHRAVYYSGDGAATWQLLSENLTTDRQADTPQYRSPHFRRIGLSRALETDNTLFVAGFDGLFVSHKAGTDWKQLETLPVRLIKGLDVFASPDITALAVTTYGGGAYVSRDRGETWLVGNAGLATTRLSDIRFSPVNHHRDNIVFSASMGYLLRSDDGGESWNKTSLKYNGIRKKLAAFLNTMTAKLGIPYSWNDLLLTNLEMKRPWPTAIAVSREFEKDQTLFFGTRYHGLYRSSDGGRTHVKLWDGTGRTIPSLVISPNFSEDKTLLASVRGGGVYKSDDAGKSWEKASAGLDFVAGWQQNQVVHQIKKKDIRLVISPAFKQDRTVYAAGANGLYQSMDAGGTWRKIQHPVLAAGENIIGCAISPDYARDRTLVISLRGRGLYRTSDGGRSFELLSREMLQLNHDIEHIAFSGLYSRDKTLFAASDEALFMSTDAGHSWRLLPRPVRYENFRRDAVRFNGQWHVKRGRQYSAGSTSFAGAPGSSVALDFVGTGVTWIGSVDAGTLEKTKIFIDGSEQPATGPIAGEDVFSIDGLTPGAHEIRIEIHTPHGDKHAGAIAVDAFDVRP